MLSPQAGGDGTVIKLGDWIGATLEIDAWTPQWSLLAGLARGRAALLRGDALVSDPVREP